ncbi:MAG: hypothetical protein F6K47_34655 [Symploca sp. SIO2E6]|nr:hypothetical protein [Symploca sp. SIO2E6]
MPEPSCLDAFDDFVPRDILSHYLSVLQNYVDFEPTPSISDIRHALVEAVIRYGRGEETLELALFLQTDDFPKSAVLDALRYLEELGLNDSYETLAAQRLVDHLLDSEKTRQATVNVFQIWVTMDYFNEVIDAVRPRLNDAELLRLVIDDEAIADLVGWAN